METTADKIEVLNDLLAINNDRIRGYESAIEQTGDNSLRNLFGNMIEESKLIRLELAEEVKNMGGEFETGTTGAGKLYRAWTDIKTVFTGPDSHSILSNCEFGEDAAQRAYNDALANEGLEPSVRQMLVREQQTLKLSHDKIKALRSVSA